MVDQHIASVVQLRRRLDDTLTLVVLDVEGLVARTGVDEVGGIALVRTGDVLRVPEPGTLELVVANLVALGLISRHRRRR